MTRLLRSAVARRRVSGVVRHAVGAFAGSGYSARPVWPANSVGDVAFLVVSSTGTIGTPAGWTLLASLTGTAQHLAVFWQRVTAVQSGTVAVAVSASGIAYIVTYSGASASVAPTVATGSDTSTTPTTPALATRSLAVLIANATAVTMLSGEAASDGLWTPSRVSTWSATPYATLVTDDGPTTGVSSSPSATWAASTGWVAVWIVLTAA